MRDATPTAKPRAAWYLLSGPPSPLSLCATINYKSRLLQSFRHALRDTMTSETADGEAGARRAAAHLTIAVCGETAHTSMGEDAAKVDLKISFRHAFIPTKLLNVHIQVKSGSSYRSAHTDQTKFKL